MDADSVGILSGTDEGVFGWFTLNYLTSKLKHLKNNGLFKVILSFSFNRSNQYLVQKTSVALDLGGGSTQITFAPKNFDKTFNDKVSKADFGHTLRVFGNKIKLYTHR